MQKTTKRAPRRFPTGGGEIKPGTCRVCGCTEDRACEPFSCTWVDPEQTICSVCVDGIFLEVLEERRRQIAKWGNRFPSGGFLTLNTVLGEEVGEGAKAILQGDRPNLEVELVQVMAVCARMLEYLRDGVHHLAIVDHDQLQLRQKRQAKLEAAEDRHARRRKARRS